MTQYQQVVAAVRKIGGKGSIDAIHNAIDGIDEWKAKNKKASVASYLSTSDEFRNENGVWIYEENPAARNNAVGAVSSGAAERGLYFITLNLGVKPPVPGLLFKIGMSDGNVGNRLKAYSASLPYNPIQELAFYPIPLDIDLRETEAQVRGELMGNNDLGFRIVRFYSPSQVEWLQTLDLELNYQDINRLAAVVSGIVNTTIDNLRKAVNNDDE